MLPFNTPVLVDIDGLPMEFPKLLIDDYAGLFVYYRKNEKARIELQVKEDLLSKEDAKKMLLGLAANPDNIFVIQEAVSDPAMTRAILQKSWAKTNRGEAAFEEFIKNQDPSLLADIAVAVTRRFEQAPPEDNTPKNPQPPATGANFSASTNTTGFSAGLTGVTPESSQLTSGLAESPISGTWKS